MAPQELGKEYPIKHSITVKIVGTIRDCFEEGLLIMTKSQDFWFNSMETLIDKRKNSHSSKLRIPKPM